MKNSLRSVVSKFMNMVVAMLVCIVATTSFFSCSKDEENDAPNPPYYDESMADSRTVLVYMVAENSLASYTASDINEMLYGMRYSHLKPGDNLVVYVDDTDKPRIYNITPKDTILNAFTLKPEYTYSEDKNSADANHLGEVIDYVKRKHPAESYGLVLWSHGSGWIPDNNNIAIKSKHRAFGLDNNNNTTYNSGNQMNISDMARCIESRIKFEYIFFDACFMQCIELDYELRNATKYVVASPAEIPGPGADYRSTMSALFKADSSAYAIVDAYYKTYVNDADYGVIISSVEVAKLDNFLAYMKNVVRKHPDSFLPATLKNIQNYFDYSIYSSQKMPDFLDIKGIAASALSETEYAEWNYEYSKIIDNCKFTQYWYSRYPNMRLSVDAEQCGGVSMFLPIPHRYWYLGMSLDVYEAIMNTDWGRELWSIE